MPLVTCKCTNCGANLQVDSSKDAAICEYCGSAFIVERAVNNYNVTNHITAGVVNVYGGNSSDFVVRAGVLEKYCGSATDIEIPNNVTQIQGEHLSNGYRGAFQGCVGLEKVVIPNSVKIIGPYAFMDCHNLKSIILPNSITSIGEGAFSGCSCLTSIRIPKGISVLEPALFFRCKQLETVTIPDTVTTIGDLSIYGRSGTFEDCESLKNVDLPYGLTGIGYQAFKNCKSLIKITIPSSVTVLGEGAFTGCSNLNSLSIPNSIQKVGWPYDGLHELKNVAGYGLKSVFGGNYARNDPNGCNDIVRTIYEDWEKRNYPPKPPQPSKGPCYIATSVYGSYDCPPVWTLRRFRDYILDSTWYGRAFIKTYYTISPTLVKWFGHTAWFQRFWRRRLDKMVERLNKQGVKDTPYQDKQY